MSSPTDHDAGAARRAVRRAGLAPYLSWIAGLIGLGFVVVFLFQAGLFAYLVPGEKAALPSVENPDLITSHDSTLSGVDRDNQPYEVKAGRAWQDKDRPELVHMEEVAARFRKATGEAYDMNARAAHYDTKLMQLDLAGDVVIVQEKRFTARMAQAHITLADKKLTSGVAVVVEFGDGTIRANGLQITDDGADILFLNGVKARFAAMPATGDTTP
jgi:lipopolysaccharide export system protein LptC